MGWSASTSSRCEKLSAVEEELDCFAHVQQLKEEALEPMVEHDMI